MDQVMFDDTDPPPAGDEVTGFRRQRLPIELLHAGGTICYELVCSVGPVVTPRRYVRNEKRVCFKNAFSLIYGCLVSAGSRFICKATIKAGGRYFI